MTFLCAAIHRQNVGDSGGAATERLDTVRQMPSDRDRAQIEAEVRRRRGMVIVIAVLLAFAVIVITPFVPWWVAAAVATLGVIVVVMAIARYRQIVAQVRAAGY